QVLPALLIVSAFGLCLFLSGFSGKTKTWILVLLLVSSAALDWIHLNVYYKNYWGTPGLAWQGAKSPERYRAFLILDQTRKEKGLGILLTEFAADTLDQTLTVAS